MWDLQNMSEVFSRADAHPNKTPDGLGAWQPLWGSGPAHNNTLPLDWRGPERFSVELTGKPSLAAGRKTFVYDSPLAALPEAAAPDLKNKSFTITAEAEIPAGGPAGMIFPPGGFPGGRGVSQSAAK